MNSTQKYSVIITGTSRGFGLMFAESLAQNSNYIIYAGHRVSSDITELNKLAEKYTNIIPVLLDVNSSEHRINLKNIITEDISNNIKLISLINNAGYGLISDASDFTEESLNNQFQTNTLAPIQLASELLEYLNNSVIINISSVASYFGLPSMGAYSASKSALEKLFIALSIENNKNNTSVVSIQPGPYKTTFREGTEVLTNNNSVQKRPDWLRIQDNPEQIVQLINKLISKKINNKLPVYKEIPMGRYAHILRLVSRWLPVEFFVNNTIKKYQ